MVVSVSELPTWSYYDSVDLPDSVVKGARLVAAIKPAIFLRNFKNYLKMLEII